MLSCGVHEALLCCKAILYSNSRLLPDRNACNGAQHERQQEDSIAVQVAPIHSYNRGLCDNSVICNSLGSHNKAVFKSNLLRILEM